VSNIECKVSAETIAIIKEECKVEEDSEEIDSDSGEVRLVLSLFVINIKDFNLTGFIVVLMNIDQFHISCVLREAFISFRAGCSKVWIP
jgi:hypothetical protein